MHSEALKFIACSQLLWRNCVLRGRHTHTVCPTCVAYLAWRLQSSQFQHSPRHGTSCFLERLQLAPVNPTSLFFGKAIANAIQLLVMMVAMFPPLVAICDVSFKEPAWLMLLTMLLGAVGLSAPGAMYAAMTSRLSNQQLLLPLMLFPLMVPVLIATSKASSLIFFGDPMEQIPSWLQLLGAFDVIYWALCGALFGRIVET